ncbi:MAG: hypothetical protein HY930_05520 [Euryarchaeota archaeon]|nr:hypothetical protein [Euryarchaeota archaeon]
MKCPLCGYEFRREEMKCKKCPLVMGECKIICCPNCNYQFVEESTILNFLQRIFRRERRYSNGGKNERADR